MYQEYLNALLKADPPSAQKANPLFSHLNFKLVFAENGEAEIRADFHPGFIQGAGVVAGGVLATLLDEAMAHAVITLLEDGHRCATIEMSTRYLSSVKKGQDLSARARVVKVGRSVHFTEATALAGDRTVATAQASFLIK